MSREVRERRRVGTGERVDRLGAVADDTQVRAVAQPRAQQLGLQRRRVLELVDEHVAETPALRGREVGVVVDGVGAACEKIVEVEPALTSLLRLVTGVQIGEFVRGTGQPAVRRACRGHILLGWDHASLRPLDFRGDVDNRHRDRRT